jgi:hypothetical protein
MTGVNAGVLAVGVDSKQRPLVMTTRQVKANDDLTNIELRRLEGGAWTQLGDALTGAPFVIPGVPRLWVDAADNPTIAYAVGSGGTSQVRVVRFEGGAWGQLGGLVDSARVIGLGVTANGAGNPPVLTLVGRTIKDGNTLFLYNPETKAWTQLPTGPTAPGQAIAGQIGTDPGLLSQDPSSGAIQLYRPGLPGWKTAGPVLATDTTLAPIGLGAGPDGAPVALLAHTLASGSVELSVRLLSGAAWTDAGAANGALAARGGSLGADGGSPLVAFFEKAAKITDLDTLHVRRLDGASWSDLTTVSDTTTALAETPAVAVKGKTGAVSWSSPGSNSDSAFGVYYRALTLP